MMPHRTTARKKPPWLLIAGVLLLCFGLWAYARQTLTNGSSTTTKSYRTVHTTKDMYVQPPSFDNRFQAALQISKGLQQVTELKSVMYKLGKHPSITTLLSSPLPSSSSSSTLPYLIIGLSTLPTTDAGELSATLRSIADQLPSDPVDPLYHTVHVYVMSSPAATTVNLDGIVEDAAFAKAKHLFRDNQSRLSHLVTHFIHADNDRQKEGGNNNNADGFQSSPSSSQKAVDETEAQQVSRNMAYLLQQVHGKSRYFLALDASSILCPHTLSLLRHAVNKAHAHAAVTTAANLKGRLNTEWLSLRLASSVGVGVGVGFRGFVLHNAPSTTEDTRTEDAKRSAISAGVVEPRDDTSALAEYLLEHRRRASPEQLLEEWTSKKTPAAYVYHKALAHRMEYVYRFNLLHSSSAVAAAAKEGEQGKCGEPLPLFNKVDCGEDDISPCLSAALAASSIQHYPAPVYLKGTDLARGV